MRHDPYVKGFNYERALQIAEAAKGDDCFGYRREFVTMLQEAKKADGLKPLDPNRSGG